MVLKSVISDPTIQKPSSRPHLTGNIANLLIELVSDVGIDATTLLPPEHFDKTRLNDADALFSPQEYALLIQRALELTKNPSLGLELGAAVNVITHQDLGFLAMSAPTIVDAIRETVPFFNHQFPFVTVSTLLNQSKYQIRFTEQKSIYDLQQFKVDMVMAGCCSIARFLSGGQFLLQEVHYRLPKPAVSQPYEDFFNCSVRWQSAHNQLISNTTQATWPVIYADKLSHANARTRLKNKIAEDQRKNISQHQSIVSQLICDSLPNILALETIARTLNTSVRTLTRNLKKEGTSYRQILDNNRKTKAQHLFTQGYTIQQASCELGFTDAAAFSRAFHRWYDENPGAYIQRLNNASKK
ncbi:MAG: AraC family transcriptional regulator [Pseudomonadales bacterium]|nr:AraC family transcriptional regulator [Pseudomonadales bacterium]